jgi:D-alanyl-D-alanine dipeptidase
MPPVLAPVDEPLVPVAHPRIQVLENYRSSGWIHATDGTWLRTSTMERLGAAAGSLPDRWGLCVFDAWRPLPLQAELYDAAYADSELPAGFVSEPIADPQLPPPHLTGGAVDCSLTVDNIALGLGAGFDDFTDIAHAGALKDQPGLDRDLRRWLFWTMHSAGFVILDCEWWHFEYGTRRWAALTGHEPLFGPSSPP